MSYIYETVNLRDKDNCMRKQSSITPTPVYIHTFIHAYLYFYFISVCVRKSISKSHEILINTNLSAYLKYNHKSLLCTVIIPT